MLTELQLKVRVTGRHPWFYRKMIRKPQRPIAAGSAVFVVDREGRPIGTGFYNPRTELALRMLGSGRVEDVDKELVRRLDQSLDLRDRTLALPRVTSGYRLVHAEGDGFPGLILDRLGDAIVAQIGSLAIQQRLEPIGERLLERYPKARLVLGIDDVAKGREGMDSVPPTRGVETMVTEHGIDYEVVAGRGHKTGFFADQRDNRQLVRNLSKGRRVLDLFCNAGGFALNAARGGAKEVVASDLDEQAVDQVTRNAARNKLTVATEHGDAFDLLRELPADRFDLIVLDPPKWAADKNQVDAACQRYTDINRLAFEKLEPGAILVTCSCSGSLSESKFTAVIRDAAAKAGRDVRILWQGGAGPDHPVALECAETRYLKVLVMEVRASARASRASRNRKPPGR